MADWEGSRWDGRAGHYESWFQRANHPDRPLAFWIRHTIFCPAGKPEAAQGELWAVWFDGESGRNTAAKTEVPIADCSFPRSSLDVHLPGASLKPQALEGSAGALKWKLGWAGGGEPSLLIPKQLFTAKLPKAKGVSPAPNARFSGAFEVGGQSHRIDGWPGSHNHNWGTAHTDRYAWVQVCGFDNAPDVFLESMTAQLRLGPVLTPRMTVVVMQLGSRLISFNTVPQAIKAGGKFGEFHSGFTSSSGGISITVAAEAPRERFVALRYRNPPGGVKACLNTKLGSCTLTLREGGETRVLTSANRAAYEILCEEDDARVEKVGGFAA